MSTFGKNLKSLRVQRKITQKEMAAFLGMTPNAYQKYELNAREPNIETLTKLSEYFDVSADYLLCVGLFSNWDQIERHWNAIINSVIKELSANFSNHRFLEILPEIKDDKILAVQILNRVIDNIEIDDAKETIFITWKI